MMIMLMIIIKNNDDNKIRNKSHYKKCIFIVKSVINIQVTHFQKKLILISKTKRKGKSKCAICLTEKTFIQEIKYDLESELEIYLQVFLD